MAVDRCCIVSYIGIQSAINSTVMVTEEGKKTAESGIKLSQETAEAFARVADAMNEVVLKSYPGVAEAIDATVLKSYNGVAEAINDVVLSNQEASLNAINDIAVSAQQISLTAKQQALVIEQAIEAMNSLNQGAVQTASGITQTKIGIQKLNEAAQSLKTLVYIGLDSRPPAFIREAISCGVRPKCASAGGKQFARHPHHY